MPHGSGQPKGIKYKIPVDITSTEVQQTKNKKRKGLGNAAID
jgi:hypothetical protein